MKMFENFDRFSPGDVVKINKELIYYITHYAWNKEMFNIVGKELIIESFVKDFKFRDLITDVYRIQYEGYNWKIPVDCCDPVKAKKRKLNLDDDPFGEEDWGYVQEKFQYGETFIVTEKLREYIEKYKWTNMTYLINKPIIPEGYSKKVELDHGVFRNCYHYDGWSIPEDCVTKTKTKLNLEEDPYGEENWYIQENKGPYGDVDPEYSFIPNDIFREITNGRMLYASMEDRLKYLNFVKNHVLNKNVSFTSAGNDGDKEIEGCVVDVVDNFTAGGGFGIKLKILGHEKLYFIHIYKPVCIYDKIPVKKLNLEDDPFGEEDWGYMSENLDLSELNIGDRVKITSVYELPPPGSRGTIIKIDKHRALVEFDKDIGGHSGGGSGKLNHCWWCFPTDFKIIGDKKKRILNLEDDPFGEENWGYMKENFSKGDKFFVNEKLREYVRKFMWSEDMFSLIGTYVKPNEFIKNFHFDRINFTTDVYVVSKTSLSDWYIPADCFGDDYKGKIRASKPDIDPFGEEDWGYIQENFS